MRRCNKRVVKKLQSSNQESQYELKDYTDYQSAEGIERQRYMLPRLDVIQDISGYSNRFLRFLDLFDE